MYGSLSSSHSSSAMNTLRARSRGSKRLNTRSLPGHARRGCVDVQPADHRGVLVVGDRRVVGPERARLEAELAARPQRQPLRRRLRARADVDGVARRQDVARRRRRIGRGGVAGRRRRNRAPPPRRPAAPDPVARAAVRRSGAPPSGVASAAPAASDGMASAITRQTWRTSGFAARFTADRRCRCRDAASGPARRSETRCPPA